MSGNANSSGSQIKPMGQMNFNPSSLMQNNQPSNSTNLFGNTTPNPGFMGSSTQNQFQSPNNTPAPFGVQPSQSGNMFSNPQKPMGFLSASTTNTGLFGNSNAPTGIFGGNQTSNNQNYPLQNQQNQGLNTLNLFDQKQQDQSKNLFGNAQSQPGLFGAYQPDQSKNLFASTQISQPGLFGSNQQDQSKNLFGNTQNQTGMFASNPQTSQNLFGNSQSTGLSQNQNGMTSNNKPQTTLFNTFGQNQSQNQGQNQIGQQMEINQGMNQSQTYFQPNYVFALNNLIPKNSQKGTILSNYKLIHKKDESDKTPGYDFLFQVSLDKKLSLSDSNSLNSQKISAIDKKYSTPINSIEETLNQQSIDIQEIKKAVIQMDTKNRETVSEKIRDLALQTKETNSKIEALFHKFETCNKEFKEYQSIVVGFQAQVPVFSHQSISKTQFPSQALQSLSRSLSDKLNQINLIVEELISVLLQSTNKDSEEDGFNAYLDLIDELFYLVKNLSAQNAIIQMDLKMIRGRIFGNVRDGENNTTMIVEDEHDNMKTMNEVSNRLNKIIYQTKE